MKLAGYENSHVNNSIQRQSSLTSDEIDALGNYPFTSVIHLERRPCAELSDLLVF